MLCFKTIDFKTLDILKKLQAYQAFSGLRLAGGTGLALQIGHRKSIDIDLFGNLESDFISISKSLNSIGKTVILSNSENIHVFSVDEIKVDIVNYPYPWLEAPICEDSLIIAGQKDIAAMKLAAITNRGSRKDFIDIFFLLRMFSLSDMLDFYAQKFRDGSVFLVLKSLSYFEDAELDESPKMLELLDWNEVKKTIGETVRSHLL